MDVCTVKLHKNTKTRLDVYREYRNESYDEIVAKLLSIIDAFKNEPKLGKKTIAEIEKARQRISSGTYISENEAKKRLGM